MGNTTTTTTTQAQGLKTHTHTSTPSIFHCNAGYTAKEVKALLALLNGNSGNSNGSGRLKRVVMLSSVGVNRRDDLMLKLRQMHTNLEERVRACVRACNR